MLFTLFAIFSLFILTTFVQSAPTTSLDSATLLNNALEAQRLNAQFQTANSTATGSCTNGDTTCVQDAIATCVNGQFDASKGRCPASQKCFALPSVNSNGTTIACTSEKSALSLIKAAGATGDVTGSGSGSSINPASASFTLSGAATPTSMNAITPTSIAPNDSVVTVTVTLIASSTTTLPPVTQTLSPEQAASLLSSVLDEGGPTSSTVTVSETLTVTDIPTAAPTATGTSDVPSEVQGGPQATSSTVTVSETLTVTEIPTATGTSDVPSEVQGGPQATSSTVTVSETLTVTDIPTTVPASASSIPSSASPSATTPVEIVNTTGSPTSGSGGYSGY